MQADGLGQAEKEAWPPTEGRWEAQKRTQKMSIYGHYVVCDQCETQVRMTRKEAKALGWETNIEPTPAHEALYSDKRDECPDCKPETF